MTGKCQQAPEKEHLLGKHITRDKLHDVICWKNAQVGFKQMRKCTLWYSRSFFCPQHFLGKLTVIDSKCQLLVG